MRGVRLALVVVLVAAGAAGLIRVADRGTALAAGGLLTLVSLVFLVVSRVQLGSSFAVRPQAKKLVTHGLYRKIPDPLYAFLDLALVGVIVAARQAVWLFFWAVLVAAHVWAARREAAVLEGAFGDEYRAYRRTTWW